MLENNYIILSSEHAEYLPEIQKCFKDSGLTVSANYARNAFEDLPMQIIIFLGKSFISGVAYDVIKLCIKKLFQNYKDAKVRLNGKRGIMFSIKGDLSASAIVLPNDKDKFQNIKNLDDAIEYLKNQTQEDL